MEHLNGILLENCFRILNSLPFVVRQGNNDGDNYVHASMHVLFYTICWSESKIMMFQTIGCRKLKARLKLMVCEAHELAAAGWGRAPKNGPELLALHLKKGQQQMSHFTTITSGV